MKQGSSQPMRTAQIIDGTPRASVVMALTKDLVAAEVMESARRKIAVGLDIAAQHIKVSLEPGEDGKLRPQVQIPALRYDRETAGKLIPEVGQWMLDELRWRLPGVEETRGASEA